MTLSQLKKLTAIWVERLKLLDWDIAVRWSTAEETENGYGFCHYHHETKEATIIITDPKFYSEEDQKDKTKDPEVFIVHELSHLYTMPFGTKVGSIEAIAEENIVNLYSRLLIAVDRRDDEITGRKLSRKASFKVRKTIIKDVVNPKGEIECQLTI